MNPPDPLDAWKADEEDRMNQVEYLREKLDAASKRISELEAKLHLQEAVEDGQPTVGNYQEAWDEIKKLFGQLEAANKRCAELEAGNAVLLNVARQCATSRGENDMFLTMDDKLLLIDETRRTVTPRIALSTLLKPTIELLRHMQRGTMISGMVKGSIEGEIARLEALAKG